MRLSKSLCAVVGDALSSTGSHASLEALFVSAGAPGEPPALAHHSKWKEWLFRAGQHADVDSLDVLGSLLEEFMDTPPPQSSDGYSAWEERRARVVAALEENGLRYYRFGRILPLAASQEELPATPVESQKLEVPCKPQTVEELLEVVIKGLRRAMHPLAHRRKGAQSLSFGSEYDVQDLLHALLRPWIQDIRPEEFTPSYAGSSTRMDFLLPAYGLVIETKIVRDRSHARNIGNELIIDIEHYRKHPDCKILWCVIYDPSQLIANAQGLKSDLEGVRVTGGVEVLVRVQVLVG